MSMQPKTTKTPKLSPAQTALLQRLADGRTELAPAGNRASGRAASAWWRTARKLLELKLVELNWHKSGVRLPLQGPKTLAQHIADKLEAKRVAKARRELWTTSSSDWRTNAPTGKEK